MKRSATAIVVAIVVVVAGVIGLTLWRGTGSSVALADVLTQIQQVSVYMYQMTISTTGAVVDDAPLDQELNSTVLMSQDRRMKVTMDMGIEDPETSEPIRQEIYVLPQEKKMVTLMSGQKKYMEMDLGDTEFEETRKENNDPSAMVELILASGYTSLGRSTIDGIEVEGFQSTDPNLMGGMMPQIDVKIWVDVKSRLPVRFEMDAEMGAEIGLGADVHAHTALHDFQWDVSVAASEFEPVIPDDYTSMTDKPIKMPAMDEESALEGLRLFAELGGAYPEKLDLMTLLSQASELATKNMPSIRELMDQGKEVDMDARTQAILETTMPIQGLGMFHMLLVQEGKEPVYHGDIVTPADENQVLLRWKVSETEYRVIFGSLRAETVTAETLAELEAKLPK
jgi:outer membrane lipoprotein-sorting protein